MGQRSLDVVRPTGRLHVAFAQVIKNKMRVGNTTMNILADFNIFIAAHPKPGDPPEASTCAANALLRLAGEHGHTIYPLFQTTPACRSRRTFIKQSRTPAATLNGAATTVWNTTCWLRQ